MSRQSHPVVFPLKAAALSVTATAIVTALLLLWVTMALTDNDASAVTGVATISVVVWLMGVAGVPVLASCAQRGPMAAGHAFLTLSGARMLMTLVVAMGLILVMGMPATPTLLSGAVIFQPVLVVEVLFLLRIGHQFPGPVPSTGEPGA